MAHGTTSTAAQIKRTQCIGRSDSVNQFTEIVLRVFMLHTFRAAFSALQREVQPELVTTVVVGGH
jgi:hypothetical protein